MLPGNEPGKLLEQDSPELQMIQGDKDTTIPVKHAYYMKQRADAVKAPVEIMIINNAGHNWRKVDADIDPTSMIRVQLPAIVLMLAGSVIAADRPNSLSSWRTTWATPTSASRAARTFQRRTVTSSNIGATSLALAGGHVQQAGLNGNDITCYMTGRSTDAPHDALDGHTGSSPRDITGVLREGDYKMLARRGQVQLFNIKDDASESTDLANSEPQRAVRMLAQWKAWNDMNQPP